MEADSKEHTVLIYFYSMIFSHHSPHPNMNHLTMMYDCEICEMCHFFSHHFH